MTQLSKIQRGRTSKPPRIALYGTEGIGKSTFCSQAPSPIFIQTEDGLGEIESDRFPRAERYSEVITALTDLHEADHAYETVAIDSLDWLERLIWDQICADHGANSIETVGGGYGKGYMLALIYWREVTKLLDALRNDRSMVVLLIAHSKIERFEDPEASPYDRYCPRLNKHAAALVCEWADAVLFATRKIRTKTEDAGFNRARTTAHAIGKDGGDRILRCVGGPSCVAKNRYGITEELPLSWAAFVNAMSLSQLKE